MHNFRDITQNITVVKQVCHTYLHTNHSRCWKYPSCVVTVDTLNHSLAHPFKGSGLHPNSITGCIRALLQNYCIRNSEYTRAFRYLHCTTRGIFEVLLWFVKENKSAMLVCFTTVCCYISKIMHFRIYICRNFLFLLLERISFFNFSSHILLLSCILPILFLSYRCLQLNEPYNKCNLLLSISWCYWTWHFFVILFRMKNTQ